MANTIAPRVETTEEFIVIKIPRALFSGKMPSRKVSLLERGLKESLKEAHAGKLHGPFRNAKEFLRALKNPAS